jgi:hypothetical protein
MFFCYRTLKGFVSSVSPQVSRQLLFGEESLGAVATFVIAKLKMKKKNQNSINSHISVYKF